VRNYLVNYAITMSGGAANVGLLTNAEVADLLASQIRGNKPRGGHAKNTGAMDRKLPQVDFIERSVSKYLAATTVKGVDLTAIADIRRQLLAMSLGLMEAELLQLLNHFPQHAVEVHLVSWS
jgi:hypothetical protein